MPKPRISRPTNLRKGIKTTITQPEPHAPGPFTARQSGDRGWYVDDGNGIALLRVRDEGISGQNARWIAKALTTAHQIEVTSEYNQAALARPMKVIK